MTDTISPSTVLKHTSRFTEHFDLVPPAHVFESFTLESTNYDIKPQRSMSISATRSFAFSKPVRMHSSPAITTHTVDSPNYSTPSPRTQSPDPTKLVSGAGSPAGQHSETPPIPHHQATSRKTGQPPPPPPTVSLLYKDYASSSSTSFNRADIMIKRLCNWIVFLKLVSGWVDEIAKRTGTSAFKKQKKEHPELYDQINKKRKKCQGIISNYKKECRDKVSGLKINPALNMEELLLRAKETRKRMAQLTKLCEYVGPSSPEMDPWLANLQVLRYLKRETAEENRLRELMVPIQQEIKELECRLVDSFTDVIDFCVEQQTTVIQYGHTLDQVLGHFLPQHTWQAFVTAQQKEWVDENHIRKNYMHINYPNKQHTHVATAQKGVLGRRSGVLKHYHDKYYVLTHYGYLHQFKLDDKVKPEDSIYVASSTTIQPEMNDKDIQWFDEHGSIMDGLDSTDKNSTGSGYTFEIHYKRKKTYHFKTTTGKELVSWCRALTNVANGSSVEKLLIHRKQRQAAATTNSLVGSIYQHTIKNTGSSIITQQPPPQQQPQTQNDETSNNTNESDDDNMSQFHSCHFSDDDSVSPTDLAESDSLSLDDVLDPGTFVKTAIQQQQSIGNSSSFIRPDINHHQHNSDIYSSSPSVSLSSSSISLSSTSVAIMTEVAMAAPEPSPRRGIPTYQAHLNKIDNYSYPHH